MRLASHVEWFREHPDYQHVPKEIRPAFASGVVMISGEQPAGVYRRPAAPEFTLQLLMTDGTRAQADHGGSRWETVSRRGYLVLSPAAADLEYDNAGPLNTLTAVIQPSAIQAALPEPSRPSGPFSFGSLHDSLFEDELCRSLLLRLWSETAAGHPHGALFADAAAQTLALALIAKAGVPIASKPLRGGLAPWQSRRVTECLEEHLADDIPLAALAALVDLTPNHFCTAFRVSFGEPPHRYLIRRRIERAKEMLTDLRVSVTDIALAVGFGSSAHFATAFRKQVGVTPTAYRRERSL